MNFFKKLFGSNESKSEPKVSVKIKIISQEINESDIQQDETPKSYDISEINKQSTQVKKKEGLLAAIEFVKDFISSNDIELHELISLFRKTIPYMIKEKSIENSEIVSYIESQITRFSSHGDLEYQTDIAYLFGLVDNSKAIEYLENKLGDFEKEKKKAPDHFDSIIQLAGYYLMDKQGDKAFQTISRAGQLVTYLTDKYDYIRKHSVIAEKNAAICLNGQKEPKYAAYLHYAIVAFILDIAHDAKAFPYLSGFFHRKNICYNKSWGFQDNTNFDKALDDLNIFSHKQDLLKYIYEFAFNDLPVKMGIPKKYLKEDVLENINKLNIDNDYNNPEQEKIMTLQEELIERPFDISLVHNFSSEVVKKYYDKAMDGK